MTVPTTLDRDLPSPSVAFLLWAGLIVAVELGLVGIYILVTNATLLPFHLYPFVWINVAAWAIWRTDVAPAPRRQERVATVIAVGYFLALAYFGGLVGSGGVSSTGHVPGWSLALTLPPGHGPALLYADETVRLAIQPYTLIGYLALAYLVYATVIDAAGAAVSGLLGLLSCVSCSWPLITSIVTGVAGGSTGLLGAVYEYRIGLSTLVFVVTVALLYWRPFGR